MMALFLKLFLPLACRAQLLTEKIDSEQNSLEQRFTDQAGFDVNATLGGATYKVIQGFLSLLAIIFIILVIYAGYSWMSAQGEEAKVTKAKDTIYRAIIGLILILAAYSITYFVFKYVPFGAGGTGYSGY